MDNLAKPSDIDQSLKGAGCGALLHFAPGTNNLKCDYCGVSNEIHNDESNLEVTAVDYETFIAI
jgi:LSD1 subclass zinc finger protein